MNIILRYSTPSSQFLLALLPVVASVGNFEVPWSTAKFGPDGPWQAVRITVGGDDNTRVLASQSVTELSVYPGGEWESFTYTKTACESFPDSLCGAGGTWDPELSQSPDIAWPANFNDDVTGTSATETRRVVLGLTIGDRTVWNASLVSVTTANVTYPNGKVGGVPLGQLSLGAENTKQLFSLNETAGYGINASTFSGQLYEDRQTPSYSYGLHIGSAAFNYPGSLIFGGFDKGRVIGSVTSFANQSAIDLLDIGIGVESGASPFNFTSKEKLLSTGQTKARPDPINPYLSLPRETCDNLASLLPVTYDSGLKYYLWNTNDPSFARIVSSPAYLRFTFPPAPGTKDNVAIKVPFALLNLTLDRPITDTPKQYFPCLPYNGELVLGRAFLQAAFVGRNWRVGTSWLAQAPGPGVARVGLGYQRTDIPELAATIEGFSGPSLFNDSWAGHWSIIQCQHPSNNASHEQPAHSNSPSYHSSGLSTAGKAGIGAGAAVGALALVGALAFFWRRKRSLVSDGSYSFALANGHSARYDRPEYLADHWQNDGLVSEGHLSEMPTNSEMVPVEIPDSSIQRAL